MAGPPTPSSQAPTEPPLGLGQHSFLATLFPCPSRGFPFPRSSFRHTCPSLNSCRCLGKDRKQGVLVTVTQVRSRGPCSWPRPVLSRFTTPLHLEPGGLATSSHSRPLRRPRKHIPRAKMFLELRGARVPGCHLPLPCPAQTGDFSEVLSQSHRNTGERDLSQWE